MPLEAALPAVIYEEFTAAVARAEEARDEIPAHPDDVETPDEQEGAQAAPAQEAPKRRPLKPKKSLRNRPQPRRRHPARARSASTGSTTSGRIAKAAS